MRWILLKWTWETIILIHIYKDTPHTSAWEWEGLAVMVCGALTRGPSSSLFSSSHSPSLSSFFPSHRTALQYNSLFQQTQLLSTSLRLNYDRLMKAGCWKMSRGIHGCVVLWMGTRWHMLCCYVAMFPYAMLLSVPSEILVPIFVCHILLCLYSYQSSSPFSKCSFPLSFLNCSNNVIWISNTIA